MSSSDKKTAQNEHRHVLIVEDEPALVDIYSTKLKMEGFEVISAQNGVEGLEKALIEHLDLILLDVLLPLKDGFDVLKDLKSNPKTRPIPVVMLSNLGQEYEIKKGLALGAKKFLTKANLTPAKVVDEVKKILADSQASQ